MSIAARLQQQIIMAGVAITDVSIVSASDKATWLVRPSSLQAQAQAIIDAYVDPSPAQLADEDAARDIDVKALKSMLLEIYPYLGAGKPTLKQLRDDIIARYKVL